MTRQWQDNDNKQDKKNGSYFSVFFCHVFVMFHCFPLCFHDSNVWCVMFNCFFFQFSYFCSFVFFTFYWFLSLFHGFLPFLVVFLFFVGFLHVFIGFLLLFQQFSLFFHWVWLIFQWFCCFQTRLNKWLKTERQWQKMTGKSQKNMTKTQVFGKFHFRGFNIFCYFSVMFLSCLIDVLDVFMILVRDVPFAFPFRMSPKYGGWNRVPKELMMEIPVKMGCNEIIIICTWNACIIKKSRTKQNKKIIRIFFQAYKSGILSANDDRHVLKPFQYVSGIRHYSFQSVAIIIFHFFIVFFHLFISFFTFPLIFVPFPWFSSIVSLVFFSFSLVFFNCSMILLLSC